MATAGVPAAAARGLSPRTRRLLEGPVAPTLLRLAAPNGLVMVLQAAVSTLDAVFVGWLGSGALAGGSPVFPLVMLMQTVSAGGMGGGVASPGAPALCGGARGQRHLVQPGQPGAARLPPLRPEPGAADTARPAPAVGALLGDPPRGRPGLAEHDPDEPDRGAPHRAGRALRRHRAGRLRPGRAAR